MNIIETFLDKLCDVFLENSIDWIITGIITYFTVIHATHRYYGKKKRKVAESIMEQSLRALFKLDNNEELPDTAKVILVEYKGRCFNFRKKKSTEKDCIFFEKIRKTVAIVGGDVTGVSTCRPREYGVLGIANYFKRPVIFNFQNGDLFKYEPEQFKKVDTKIEGDRYIVTLPNGTEKEVSEKNTSRDIMIAAPIEYHGKLIGGITFDMRVGAKTIYQNICEQAPIYKQHETLENNIKVFKEVRRTVNHLIEAYFKNKEDHF